jgi:hypothetical protein
MAGLTVIGTDTRGIDVTLHVTPDGRIVADTPDSAFPPNELVVARLHDGLVPDTSGDGTIDLRGRRFRREDLREACALAIFGWLLTEWARFGVQPLQGVLARIAGGHAPAPEPVAHPTGVGVLDPEFGSKLAAQVMEYLEQWRAGVTHA